jgi:hypothetical protein
MICVLGAPVILVVTVDNRLVWHGDRVIVVATGRVAGESAETNAMLIRAPKIDIKCILGEIERV